ncbi:hypothetical protein AA313_de0200694 [Arthrobotrys entomopaga]|nr:hypothetical protein AA313_de0200694 [Arthrobotrys entomopaga]
MRSHASLSLLSALLLLPISILAESTGFTGEVESDGVKFNFKELKQHSVVVDYKDLDPPSKTTITINPLGKIEWPKDTPKDEQCHDGTQVCMVKRAWHNDKPDDHTFSQISTADISDDTKPEYSTMRDASKKLIGLNVTLHGPGGGENKKKQATIIHFLCDDKMTGNEEPDKDGKGDNALKYISYEDNQVLTLEWRTGHACEEGIPVVPPTDSNGSWGFFTWFILIAFMAVAAYLIFGSWFNYNKYGARGWDLLPHSDTLRDLPYLIKDFLRRAVNTFQGTGGRGGYSAI